MAKTSVNNTIAKPRVSGKSTLKKNYGIWTAVIVTAITLVVLFGIVFGYCVYLVNSQSGIFNGVTIAGIDVSGLTRREAVSRLESQMDTVMENLNFDVIAGDYTYTVESEDLGLSYDAGSAAAKAYNYGRDGSFFENVYAAYVAKTKGYDIAFDYTYDTQKVEALALKIAQEISTAPKDTVYEIGEESVVITLGSSGVSVSAGNVETLLKQRLEGQSGDIVIGEEGDRLASVDLEKIKKEVDREATDAYVDETDPNNPVLVPSQTGRIFDIEKAKAILAGEGDGDGGNVYTIDFEIIEPEIKTEDVEFYTYNDLISTATTYLNPGQKDRTSNVQLACQKINGIILKPGEEFSFNTVVGERTYEAGFKDAAIYQSGEIVDGVGGGICQVSSTLYMGAVYADLEITSRRNHRFTVTYTELGQDATVAYDSGVDFKFRNDRDTAIKVMIVQESDYVKCEIYGTYEEGEESKTTTMESKTIGSTAFKTVYVIDESVPVNTQKLKNNGYTGYSVETYRVVRVNGEEVSRTLENTSKYTTLNKTYLINPQNAATDADGNVSYVEYVEPEPDIQDPGEDIQDPNTGDSEVDIPWIDDNGENSSTDDPLGDGDDPFWMES